MDRAAWVYKTSEIFVNFYFKTAYRLACEGEIPKEACVLLPKHQQMLDIPLEGHIIYRQIRRLPSFVMRGFPFPFNYFFQMYGGIEIARAKEIRKGKMTKEEGHYVNERAVQKAIERLRRGEPAVIHPEGTRKWQEMNSISIRPKSVLEQIIEAQKYLGPIPFIPIGINYSGNRVTVKIGSSYYTKDREKLEQHLKEEIPKLSGLNCKTDN